MRDTATPRRETSEVGRKGTRPGGRARHQQDEVNLERGLWRVSGQGDHSEARAARSPSWGRGGVSLGSFGASSWCAQAASRRVEAEQAAWQRGGQGDTEGKDECVGTWALLGQSCCLGRCLGRSHWVE